jgi:type VI protein secretion system component VasF
MALFIRQDDNRSKLQERLATELQEKAKARAETTPPDGVTDSHYLEGTKSTTSLAWVWIAIIIAVAVVVLIFMFSVN